MMTKEVLYCGVDCGSSEIKLSILDANGKPLATRKAMTLFPIQEHVNKVLQGRGDEISVSSEQALAATGYGRNHIERASLKLTEIKAHFLGVQRQLDLDRPYTIVDIGGQDSKVISVKDGRVDNFVMNRKCAAGTGAFIEELAHRLRVELSDLTTLARNHDKVMDLNSYCTVFSGQELIKILMNGERVENLIYALYRSVVQRIMEMTAIATDTVVFSGGVMAHNPVLLELFQERMALQKLMLAPNPQYCGAIGAAIALQESMRPIELSTRVGRSVN